MQCKNCNKNLLDTRQKFCSIDCQDIYIQTLEKRLDEALKNDSSHTENLSYMKE